jgi:hypothetical protein
MSREIIDSKLKKLISRKLLVWVAGTTLLVFGKIDADAWVSLSLAYVSVQGFADLAIAWKKN